MKSLIIALALFVGLTGAACGDTVINVPTAPSTPLPTTPAPVLVTFRVLGNPASARVRYSAPADGLAQVVTALPYSAGFSSSASSLFLSLEATPLTYPIVNTAPFFAVQILVNGVVFREATTSDTFFAPLSVAGTWRRDAIATK